jgi:hypothetical protein
MLSSGMCPGSPPEVYSNLGPQMDRIYRPEDEEEEEDRGLERSQGDLEERVRTICPANSWRLGICELLSYSGAPDLTYRSAQTKTLDHRPPMSQVEFDTSVNSTFGYPATYFPQFGPGCQRCYSGRHTSKDDCERIFRLVLCSIEDRWKGANRWARFARLRLRHVPYSLFTG